MQKIELWPLEKLIQYARNPRKNDHAVDKLAAAIKEFGFRVPILAKSDGLVIDGHLRLKAAIKLGMNEVPVLIADDLTETQIKAFRISVNRMADLANWDDELLALEIEELKLDGFDLDLTGFDAVELDELLGGDATQDGLTDPDEVPETPATPVSQKGDVWIMGRHRLMCGDSTDAATVATLMGGEMAALVVTDPPYGVSYADKNRHLNAIGRGNRIQVPIANDHLGKDETQAMWKAAFAAMSEVMRPGAVVYCFMPQGGDQMMMMMMMMMEAGIEPRHELIWLKNNHVLGRTDYAYKHEPILYAWKSGGHKFYGDFQTSILEFAKPQKSDMHPTMKPVPLIERLIENSSKTKDLIYEPFSGSGTTIIAAEKTGRRCYAMELSPQYVDVAVKRWQQFTGKQATHAVTGEPFTDAPTPPI